jgi:ubiquinone/menaquinone biosynthesis C-methylase UbiE
MNTKDCFSEYDRLLDQFVTLGIRLANNNQGYLATILGHELVRYTYPVEPYAGFTHTDPMSFIMERIQQLIALGETWSATVVPYSTPAGSGGPAAADLETETSDLYSALWTGFDAEALERESVRLLAGRLPAPVIEHRIRNRRVIDIGCGSGRYALALAQAGAAEVVAIDYQAKAFARAEAIATERGLPVRFMEANVLEIPFPDGTFDFVFSNGVLHHTGNYAKAVAEYARMMAPGGYGFLYLYAAGGVFWTTRRKLRTMFRYIPKPVAQQALRMLGMPENRFFFMDTWYVPVENHITTADLQEMIGPYGIVMEKIISTNAFDLDRALAAGIPGAVEMWGEGEHRYLTAKPA